MNTKNDFRRSICILLVAEAPFPPYILRDMNPEVKKVLFSKDEQHLMEDEKDQVGGQPDDAKCKH